MKARKLWFVALAASHVVRFVMLLPPAQAIKHDPSDHVFFSNRRGWLESHLKFHIRLSFLFGFRYPFKPKTKANQ